MATLGKPGYEMPPARDDKDDGAFMPEDFMYGASVERCSADVRNGFLRKVYGLLGAQLALTAALACLFMFHAPVHGFVLSNRPMLFVSFLASLGLLFACHANKDRHPVNLVLLGGFTLAMAYSVAFTCALYMANGMGYIVLQAFVLTAAVTLGLSAYALTSKRDFSFMRAGLSAGLFALILAGVVNWLLLWVTGSYAFASGTSLLLSGFGALLFSAFIVYDTWMISKKMGPDQYVQAAISLYLDIINLFVELLRILAYLQNGGND
eukprot:CAMPEP_0206046026 /NCGR_PEP_ID=MMETSP1466-20131121/17537_1 /ASSEMBLY_ACC=CAM_ASM_001126 /TAXON_ID=44452 /ORGANISM="Pavlova gyrans, Strain CCMP608" /LENGTH=264 /DNA_ID=CAMNT_0053420989 /DNA_START=41 /DNA_END=835 /DNA_ORIENTATION=+